LANKMSTDVDTEDEIKEKLKNYIDTLNGNDLLVVSSLVLLEECESEEDSVIFATRD